MITYGTLHSYRDGVASGAFDTDLDTDDRWAVVRLLDFALQRVQYANIPARELAWAVRDPGMSSDAVNVRVREIIEGCARR